MKSRTSLSILFCVYTLSACGSPPERTPYDGADRVGAIEPSLLVGDWKVSVLNPVAEENSATVTQTFHQDGTWTSVVIPPAEQTEQFGPIEYKGYGEWQIEGDALVSQMENMEETTGSKFGGIMKTIATMFMPKSTTANPYEISGTRMIFVHESTGQATLLERI